MIRDHDRMANERRERRIGRSSSRCRARRGCFPPPAEFAARALINDAAAYEKLYRRSIDDPEGFWAETARAELTWIQPFHEGARLEAALREVVRGRRSSTCRRTASTATWPRAATRPRSSGRASRATSRTLTYRELHARGLQVRERARRRSASRGRPRRHLHADDPRGGDRDARLRAHRRAAHRRLRRLLGRGAARSHQRLRRQAVHHRRRRLAARQGRAAQGQRRRRAGADADRRSRASSCAAPATRSTMQAGPRRLVGRR